MEFRVEIVEPKLFAGAVADEIVASCNEFIGDRDSCSLALAGGSTPGAVYRVLSRPPRATDLDWSKLRIYLGDERWVPKTDTLSNYKMVEETLLSHLPKPGCRMFPLNTSAKSPQEGAKEYAELIRKNEPATAEGIPQLDLVLLGMGEDGHTASIFPSSPLIPPQGLGSGASVCEAVLFPGENWNAPKPGGVRVTMTAEVLFTARRVIFIVSGENKASMVKRVIEGSESAEALPAVLYKHARNSVTWFLDTGAAKELSR